MTTNTETIIDKIRGSAMLATLSLGSYNPVKLDRNESRRVTSSHGANAKAARVQKNTLPTAGVLDRIAKHDAATRADFDSFTAPYARGVGLLPASRFLELRSRMTARFSDREVLVRELANDYAAYLDAAKRELNGLFNPADYPPVEQVVARFTAKLDVMPIANPHDTKLNVLSEVADAIQSAMADSMTEKFETVTPYLREPLLKPLSHLSAVLQNPEVKLYESAFGNVLDAADQAEHLNLSGDAQILNAAACAKLWCNVSKDLVKEDKVLRARVLSDVNQIIVSLDGEVPPPAVAKKRTPKGESVDDAAEQFTVTPVHEAPAAAAPAAPEPVVDEVSVNGQPADETFDDKFPAQPQPGQFNSDAMLAKLGW